MYKYTNNKATRLQRTPTCYLYYYHTQETMSSPSQIFLPLSATSDDERQLGIRSTGTPLHRQYQWAAEHAAMLVEASRVFDIDIPTIIPLFGQRSPSQGTITSITLLNRPNIELQAIGGTVTKVEEEQRRAYLENPDDFFGPPPGLTPSPSSSSNMHLDAEDDMLIPPNSPPPLPHPVEELLMMAPPESPLPSYSPAQRPSTAH